LNANEANKFRIKWIVFRLVAKNSQCRSLKTRLLHPGNARDQIFSKTFR